jgi:hypothetical protein
MAKRSKESAGTGYGRKEWSPVTTVSFSPDPNGIERILIKYEWRDELVRLGIISARQTKLNRLWDGGLRTPTANT